MRQDDFVVRYEGEWRLLEQWLDRRARLAGDDRRRSGLDALDDIDFAAAYRRACQHLAIARRRGYSPRVQQRLEALMQRGHDVLYRAPGLRLRRVLDFFGSGLPRLVRRNQRFVWISAVLFFVPLVLMTWLLQAHPELAHSVLPQGELAKLERMYDPADASHAMGRESGTNLQMFGFYVFNNVSIAFQAFASGLLAGIGTLYVLVFNGIMIGTVAGHLTAIGFGGPFWRFVSGHSGPELMSVVLSGAAGLQIGWALVAPGRLGRREALVAAARDGAQIALGCFGLLVLAAFIEAYWSSIGWMPSAVKFSVGGGLWLLIVLWLWRGGRRHAP
jgi:uncharacterized membrane protein SpoIIM required for sporulation